VTSCLKTLLANINHLARGGFYAIITEKGQSLKLHRYGCPNAYFANLLFENGVNEKIVYWNSKTAFLFIPLTILTERIYQFSHEEDKTWNM